MAKSLVSVFGHGDVEVTDAFAAVPAKRAGQRVARMSPPQKLDYSPLQTENSGPMMETLELAHDGMSVQND